LFIHFFSNVPNSLTVFILDIFDQLSSISNYDDITKDTNYVPPGEHNSDVSIATSNVVMDKQISVVEDLIQF